MESGLVIQLLVVAGIFAYGVRSASQKGKKSGDKKLHRMPGGENFPFPVSEPDFPVREEAVLIAGEEQSGDEDRWQYRNAVQTDLADQGAVASVTFGEDDNVEEQEELPREVTEMPSSAVTDLRTMIISSELLKPKYEEY